MREGDADGNGGSPELCRTCDKAAMPTASRTRHVHAGCTHGIHGIRDKASDSDEAELDRLFN